MPSTVQQPRILLIEDSEDDAFFFRWALQKSGVAGAMTHIADGGAAIEHLRSVHTGAKARPDIVFLDLKLPTFSGFEILQWLQQQGSPEALRVFVLSGSEHSGDMTRAQGLGAAGYFVKPVSSDQLRATLAPAAPAETAVPTRS